MSDFHDGASCIADVADHPPPTAFGCSGADGTGPAGVRWASGMTIAKSSSDAGDPSPEALLRAIAVDRDQRAFKRLFDLFAPKLKGFLMRLGLAMDQAEDLTQEVMVTIWRKADGYDPSQASAATWIFTIARNRRIDLLRRENKPALDPEEPLLRPSEPDPQEDVIARRQEDNQVRVALQSLNPDQADLIRQAFYEGLTHRALADKTGIPLGTVKSRIRLALLQLRRTLGDDSP